MRPSWLLASGLLLALGCQREQPVTVENRNLGLKVTFPGKPQQIMYSEETPLGTFQWFSLTYIPKGGINASSLHVDVGGPVAAKRPYTAKALLDGFQKHLRMCLGPITVEPLPQPRGPGFHYTAQKVNDRTLEGIVLLRRGRLYHAQGAANMPGDPAFRTFMDGFEVSP